MNLSIIIPLYNEDHFIIEILDKINKVDLPDFVEWKEVIIVDDCSSDRSFQNVSEYIFNKENIYLYQHSTNTGKGGTVKTGLEKAKGDVYLIQDADLELSPYDIPKLLNKMVELKVDFINGSRYMAGISRPISSYKRYLGNKVFTLITSIMINAKITDLECGYKLFNRNVFNNIELTEKRFGFEPELIIKTLRIRKNNMAEVPVQYYPRNEGEGKKFKNMDALRVLWTIFKYGVLKLS